MNGPASESDSLSGGTDSIRMGEMAVARRGQQLRSLLGSCVGVALYDRRLQLGGLAHIVLPDSQAAQGAAKFPGKFVDTAIPLLIEHMRKLDQRELRLEAKLAGGASMFKTQSAVQIGQRNVEAAVRVLDAFGIAIRAQDCGGEHGRRMTLDVSSGAVTIQIAGQPKIEI